jgi:hypothetical protein
MMFEKFKRHIEKNPVPEAGEVLKKAQKNTDLLDMALCELSSYIDGSAYAEDGLPWKHRLENTQQLIQHITDNKL